MSRFEQVRDLQTQIDELTAKQRQLATAPGHMGVEWWTDANGEGLICSCGAEMTSSDRDESSCGLMASHLDLVDSLARTA